MRRLPIAGVMFLVAGSLAGLAAATPLADSVTLTPRATILKSDEISTSVFGEISSGAAGEYVVVKGKECGIPGAFFRGLGGATTTGGGRWEASLFVRTTTTLRAEWNGVQSAPVVVRHRAWITLSKDEKGRLRVGVSSEGGSVDGRRVRIERLTPGGWKLLQTVTVRSSDSPGYAERAKLAFAVPKATALRAVLPLAQAKPCYLAGYSKIVRT